MKEIKDYLPFYLGCEVVDSCDGNFKVCAELNPSYLHYIIEGSGRTKCFKPILRPLSDMTKEEEQEQEKVWYSAMTPKIIDTFLQYASVTKYLLSKHFDLFGLIEAGLAIDKTKITQPV